MLFNSGPFGGFAIAAKGIYCSSSDAVSVTRTTGSSCFYANKSAISSAAFDVNKQRQNEKGVMVEEEKKKKGWLGQCYSYRIHNCATQVQRFLEDNPVRTSALVSTF